LGGTTGGVKKRAVGGDLLPSAGRYIREQPTETLGHGRVGEDRVAQSCVRHACEHRGLHEAMTSPASAPNIVKPRMRSLSAATSAFIKPRVSEVVRARNTAMIGSFAMRTAMP